MNRPTRHLAALLGLVLLAPSAFAAEPAPPANEPGLFQRFEHALGIGVTNRIRLFDGTALDHFYTWIDKQGTFVDPKGVFTVKDGLLRISGEQVGFLATKSEYSDYRLIVEYKWGDKLYLFKDKPKNSGVMVHGTGLDKVWMKSIECQIAPGSTGDVVVQSGASVTAGGTNLFRPWSTLHRVVDKEVEFPAGKWNVMEILCEGGRVQVKVNGHITIDAKDVYPNHGKILFQSNGSEIFFRRMDLIPLYPLRDPSNPLHNDAGSDKEKPKGAVPKSDSKPDTSVPETK